ncbi:DNA mismatch repair protein MutL [Endomicrobiia bacterium]|nr:DNA mismatch repair protein MutL [Endomicrobiia bacterium]GHT10860.1 DNA mismatch repair protein MutL [Endomicrobiia bacterium]GHT21345.1 DNA mismatch repair protein MutL [Endomicrobiia bacterium]GHT25924.1 DNA mismatch repair protein MutL [Endomicrobiia bacterium]GHT32329.1 DNA mismatch repair protein MutL [Endomicrobiia bacterium]
MPINILSQETVNKIAAGEVVERPLNAVKELVENSLDAFASSITVEIEEAGKKLIRVSDNGFGMDKKDLELSILRHATSKIDDFKDLMHIHSLGFRGEALASIAAVSNFEIKTRKKGENSGWKLSVAGAKDIKVMPWSGAKGTITEVKSLFFNTPARQKFLKSDSTERSRIINSLEETALANYDISFKIFSENKTVFSAAQTDSKTERIADILGKDFAKTLKNIKIDHPKISLDVYFTGRDNSLPNKKYQYLFVNSRPVNYPKRLMHCVYQSYKESIPRDKYPGILIYTDVDPSEIDVNIHPAKREVKFADENGIYDILFKALRNVLMSQGHPEIKITYPPLDKEKSAKQEAEGSTAPRFTPKIQRPVIYAREPKPKYNYASLKQTCSIDKYADVFAKQEELTPENFDSNIKVIGQVFDTYIIASNKGDLYIFDQHAAAERVRYEFYLSQMKSQTIKIQQMLMPENFDLSPSISELLKANINIFNELGISIEEFGQNSFRITAYPALLGNISMEQIVKTIISDIEDDKHAEIEQKRDKIIRSACRASIKAGDNVSFIEAKKLINDLFKCKQPFTCPHGRPTAYKISLNEIEKFFKRK